VWNELRFEIVDMDGKRIDKVLVMSAQQAPAESRPGNATDLSTQHGLQMKKDGEG
jgi:hypothetical protein